MQLRYYQTGAIDAIRQALRDGVHSPIACLPTGSGKSAVIAAFLHDLTQRMPTERFVVCVHTKELVGQLAETFERVSGKAPGMYAASHKRRQTDQQVTFCQIQSVFKRVTEFGRVALMIVDEADRIPHEGDGQYRSFIRDLRVINPDMRLVGLTATPYRMGIGLVFGEGRPFDELVFDAGVRRLMDDGFLSRLVNKDIARPDLSQVHIRQGDYVASELEGIMADEVKVEKAVAEIIKYGSDRNGWLVFCSGLKHANMVRVEFEKFGVEAPIIDGEMAMKDRDDYITRYRNRELRCLINVNVLTVGFDAPHVDLIALLRPSKSPGLYYQSVGRGLRICEGKKNCLVLDMAGLVYEHGPIDTLNDRITTKEKGPAGKAPVKTCEACLTIVAAGCRKCPECGEPFPELPVARHAATAALVSPISEVVALPVDSVKYAEHVGKDASKPPTVCVSYKCGMQVVKEWWSLAEGSHSFAKSKAMAAVMSIPIPEGIRFTVMDGIPFGHHKGQSVELRTARDWASFLPCLPPPRTIQVQADPKNPKYLKVVGRTFDEQ